MLMGSSVAAGVTGTEVPHAPGVAVFLGALVHAPNQFQNRALLFPLFPVEKMPARGRSEPCRVCRV